MVRRIHQSYVKLEMELPVLVLHYSADVPVLHQNVYHMNIQCSAIKFLFYILVDYGRIYTDISYNIFA